MRRTVKLTVAVVFAGWVCIAASADAEGGFIAGTVSDRRPQTAPLANKQDQALKEAEALHGVSAPYPASVSAMLKAQGAWYTPFTRPGMKGPYDIRQYHTKQ